MWHKPQYKKDSASKGGEQLTRHVLHTSMCEPEYSCPFKFILVEFCSTAETKNVYKTGAFGKMCKNANTVYMKNKGKTLNKEI